MAQNDRHERVGHKREKAPLVGGDRAAPRNEPAKAQTQKAMFGCGIISWKGESCCLVRLCFAATWGGGGLAPVLHDHIDGQVHECPSPAERDDSLRRKKILPNESACRCSQSCGGLANPAGLAAPDANKQQAGHHLPNAASRREETEPEALGQGPAPSDEDKAVSASTPSGWAAIAAIPPESCRTARRHTARARTPRERRRGRQCDRPALHKKVGTRCTQELKRGEPTSPHSCTRNTETRGVTREPNLPYGCYFR